MNKKEQPLVSVGFFCYQNEKYVKEGLASVLSQDYKNMEIIISDDCSTDNSYKIIKEMINEYNGPHEITLNRNNINIGFVSHWNKVHQISKGSIFVGASADDISLPDRVSKIVEAFSKHPKATVVSMGYSLIDSNNRKIFSNKKRYKSKDTTYSLDDFLKNNSLRGNAASRGYRSDVFSTFGPIGDCNTEDTPSLLRALYLGDGVNIQSKGIFYRKHENSLSASKELYDDANKLNNVLKNDLKIVENHISVRKNFNELNNWIEGKLQKDKLLSLFLHSNMNIFNYIKIILFSRYFSLHEKLNFLKKIILSHLKK